MTAGNGCTILHALLLDDSPRVISPDGSLADDAALRRFWAALRRSDPAIVGDLELLWDKDWFLFVPYPMRAFLAAASIAQHFEAAPDSDRQAAMSRELARAARTEERIRSDLEREKVRRIRRDRESRA